MSGDRKNSSACRPDFGNSRAFKIGRTESDVLSEWHNCLLLLASLLRLMLSISPRYSGQIVPILWTFCQPHTRPLAIREFNTLGLKGGADGGKLRGMTGKLPSFEIRYGIPMNTRDPGEVFDGPIQERARHSDLCRLHKTPSSC